MARSLRQDIPSRRTRNALAQLDPGMADLNPAPGVGRDGPPPSGSLDRAPAGSFQANHALNGEQGVAARQRARARQSGLGLGSATGVPSRPPSLQGWDSEAFPADHDLFDDILGVPGSINTSQHGSGGGAPPPAVTSHPARQPSSLGLEGGEASVPRLLGRGPIAPSSPDSVSELYFVFIVGRPAVSPRMLAAWVAVRVRASASLVTLVSPVLVGHMVPIDMLLYASPWGSGATGLDGWDIWCPRVGRDSGVPVLVVAQLHGLLLYYDSDASEWGGIEGEVRVLQSPLLGPPFEFRPALSQRQEQSSGVEQFRETSRSQARSEQLALVESPSHEKVVRSRLTTVPSPRHVFSQEDGGRATVRYSDHTRRRSRSVDPMDADRGVVGGSRTRSLAFPDPRTARYLDADPVGMLTSVHPMVVKVLSEGWQEPIPLGYFARWFNPLIPGQASGDLSTLRMGENGQVQVHHRRLRDLPLDDLTESDWYQVAR
ncbi:hypothetical protein FB446DRAFT_813303, partial [Lentinula raphanica]